MKSILQLMIHECCGTAAPTEQHDRQPGLQGENRWGVRVGGLGLVHSGDETSARESFRSYASSPVNYGEVQLVRGLEVVDIHVAEGSMETEQGDGSAELSVLDAALETIQ